jgi:hypothetical protein
MNDVNNNNQSERGAGFDLFRISRGKTVVDICPNTLRQFGLDGLPIYRRGKSCFISKSELAAFIRAGAMAGGRA